MRTKKLRKLILLFLLGTVYCWSSYAQEQITVKGVVTTSDSNTPLPGVNILEKGSSNNGAATDFNGNYTIQVSSDAILVISYIGFTTQEVPVNGRGELNITLDPDNEQLSEVVVVGYGKQKKETVTGAISSIKTEDIRRSSSPNLAVALTGQIPGLSVLQTSGQPGNEGISLFLRGIGTLNDASPLILIDGVPRDNISLLDPNEVESISVLKDASATAVYGVRGANGVIVVTTRRGEKGKSELNISVNHSYHQFLVKNDRINSWDFAELRNQAYLNSNPGAPEADQPFTQYMIDKYRSGEDPVFYPNRDVFHDYFRDWTPQTRLSANFNGGGDSFTYFLNAGYTSQGGNFKTESEDKLGYDPSFSMKRYNFRANTDFKVTDNLKISLNLSSYLQKVNSPQTSQLFGNDINRLIQNLVSFAWATPPTDPGPLTMPGYDVTVDEVVAQSGIDRSTYGEINRRGYRNQTTAVLNSSLTIDWGLDFITKGLSTKALIAFDSRGNTSLEGYRGVNTYSANVARSADQVSNYSVIRDNQSPSISLGKTDGTNYYTNFQYSVNYARSFGVHDVSALALFQRDNWEGFAADLPYNVIGYVGRVTYGFNDRYLAEFNLGYNGSEQFAPENRFGLFPAYSVGWIASNEGFLKDSKVVTFLKFRASYGIVGNDKLGTERFLYQSFITEGGGQIPGLSDGQSIIQGKQGNEQLQWETAEKKNIGVDLKLFKDISLTVDLFREYRDQILIGRSTVPILQGVPLGNIPKVNIGVVENQGYEIELGYQKFINDDISFSVKGNFNYNENNVEFADEVRFGEDYANQFRRTGYSIGQNFGYLIDYSNGNGYINTQEELDNIPTYKVGGEPRLGDFKYIDVTKDGVIDDRDLMPIGYTEVPRISYGFSGTFTYKNLELSMIVAGIAKSSIVHRSWGVTEFGIQGFFTDWHRSAWTPERYANGEEILYPALGLSPGTSQVSNNFFIMDRSFVRLKNIELGYNFSKKLIEPTGVKAARIFVSGSNLLTWDNLPVNTIDAEQTSAISYPLTKILSMGLNVTF